MTNFNTEDYFGMSRFIGTLRQAEVSQANTEALVLKLVAEAYYLPVGNTEQEKTVNVKRTEERFMDLLINLLEESK